MSEKKSKKNKLKKNKIIFPITWGASDPLTRGPVIATTTEPKYRNVIGTHAGAYAIYRALAVATGQLDSSYVPDLSGTSPVTNIGPHPSWGEPNKIVSLDPYGHLINSVFKQNLDEGIDIRPTIAITKAHLNLPELVNAIKTKRLKPDGNILDDKGEVSVTKIAIEPVWHLPGIAKRFSCDEATLRHTLIENTAGMFPELVTRPDLDVFLPPIGGITVYVFGDIHDIHNPAKALTCRVHDECNGSDVFGSDICTCRPYLAQGIELCVETAQKGGVGIITYNRKEGRALGEVTKFLVYNARKRQKGGDTASHYFTRTECVAGVQDLRFQELMPDVLHWLGVKKIDRFVSMSNLKYDAIISQGINIIERVPLPDELIPADATVEIDAKKAAGYFTDDMPKTENK
jgi:GTP cyclohydrolase II